MSLSKAVRFRWCSSRRMIGGRSLMFLCLAVLLVVGCIGDFTPAQATSDFVLPPNPILSSATVPENLSDEIDAFSRQLVDNFQQEVEQRYYSEYLRIKRDTSVRYRLSDTVHQQRTERVHVSAVELFHYAGQQYAIVAKQTLNGSYIAAVETSGDVTNDVTTTSPPTQLLQLRVVGSFSTDSFTDQPYTATSLQHNLHEPIVKIKSRVFGGCVLIMVSVRRGASLLFLVRQPWRSWTPLYHDSVMTAHQHAADFVFFERAGRLHMLVAVSHLGSPRDSNENNTSLPPSSSSSSSPATHSHLYVLSKGIKWLQLERVATAGGAISAVSFSDAGWIYVVIGQKHGATLVYRCSTVEPVSHPSSSSLPSLHASSLSAAAATADAASSAPNHHSAGILQLFQHLNVHSGSKSVDSGSADGGSGGGVISVHHFQAHYHHYLLVIDGAGLQAVLLRWTAEQLVVWQRLTAATSGGRGEKLFGGGIVTLPDHSVVIYLLHASTVSFYTTFDSVDDHYSLAFSEQLSVQRHLLAVTDVLVVRPAVERAPVSSGQSYYYMLVWGESITSGVGAVWLTYQISVNAVLSNNTQPSGKVSRCLASLDAELASLESKLSSLSQLADTVFTSHSMSTNNITGGAQPAVISGGVKVDGGLSIVGEAALDQVDIEVDNEVMNSTTVDRLRKDVQLSYQLIGNISSTLQNTLTISSPQTISGVYQFRTLITHGNLHVHNIQLNRIFNHSVNRLLHASLKYHDEQTLLGFLQLTSVFVDNLQLGAGSRINDVHVDTLMYTESEATQLVSGQHIYQSAELLASLHVDSFFNDVIPERLVAQGGWMQLPAVHRDNVQIHSLSASTINGVDMARWMSDVIRLDQDHSFNGSITMPHAVLYGGLFVQQLNARDVEEFLRSVWTGGARHVFARDLLFTTELRTDYLTAGLVNNVSLDTDLLTTDTEQNVSSCLRFVECLTYTGANLSVDFVNRVRLARDNVVLADTAPDSSQPPAAQFIAPGVRFIARVYVSEFTAPVNSLVNNLTTTNELTAALTDIHTPTVVEFVHTESPIVLDGLLSVTNDTSIRTLNGYNLMHLQSHFWTHDAHDVVLNLSVHVPTLFVGGDVVTSSINDIPINSLVDIKKGGRIGCNATFVTSTTFSEVTLSDVAMVNGRNWTEFLEDVFLCDKDQTVSGNKTFLGEVVLGNINLTSLNNLRIPQDIVLLSGSLITGDINFTNDVIVDGNVTSLSDVTVLKTFNNITPDYIASWLLAGGQSDASSTNDFSLHVPGDSHFRDLHISGSVNGFSIDRLLALVSFAADREVNDLHVRGHVTFASQLNVQSVNSINWQHYIDSVILRDEGGEIAGTTILFAGTNLNVSWPAVLSTISFNNHTATSLRDHFLTTDSHQTSSSTRLFINGSLVADNLTVETVNGVAVSALVFSRGPSTLQLFHNQLFFAGVTVRGRLHVDSGVVGGCNLTQLWREGVRRNASSQTLTGNLGAVAVHVLGNLEILHNATAALPLDRIITKSGNFTITGSNLFTRQLRLKSASIVLYNGANVTDMMANALTTNDQSTILSSSVLFGGGVTVNSSLLVLGNATVHTTANQRPLSSWLASVVTSQREQMDNDDDDVVVVVDGTLVISARDFYVDDLVFTGNFNGISGARLVERDTPISSHVVVHGNISVQSSLDVSGLVHGVNLHDVVERVVNVRQSVIYGNLTINGDVRILADVDVERINGVSLATLLQSNNSQHEDEEETLIRGHKHFALLKIRGRLCGSVNTVDVRSLCSSLVSSAPNALQIVNGQLNVPLRSIDGGLHTPLQHNLTVLSHVTNLTRDLQRSVSASLFNISKRLDLLVGKTSDLVSSTDWKVDLAYLLAVYEAPVSHVLHVATLSESALLVTRSGADATHTTSCQLAAKVDGCTCRYTAQFSINSDGVLRESVGDGRWSDGQVWRFGIDSGRYFTITTNYQSYSDRCHIAEESSLSISGNSVFSMLEIEYSIDWNGGYVSDVHLFQHYSTVFLLITHGYSHNDTARGGVFLYELAGSVWRLQQVLSAGVTVEHTELLATSPPPTPTSSFSAANRPFVSHHGSFTSGAEKHATSGPHSPHLVLTTRLSHPADDVADIYVWNNFLRKFELRNTLTFNGIRSVKFLLRKSSSTLAISDLNGLSLYEYTGDSGSYKQCHFLSVGGISCVVSFSIGEQYFVAAHSDKFNELVLYNSGPQGALEKFGLYPAASVRSINVVTISGECVLLVVATDASLLVYKAIVRGKLPYV